jgi:hypothetical protein
MILRAVLFLLAGSTLACAPPSAPQPYAGRLQSINGDLWVVSSRHPSARGAYLYVLAHDPLTPDSPTRPPVGVVQVTDPGSMQVAWVCPPRQPQDAFLAADGLPVEVYDTDKPLRVGKCWGHFAGQDGASWAEASAQRVVNVRIDLGPGDQVDPKVDRYELLGRAILSVNQQRVEGFEPIGVCRPLAVPMGALATECQLNLGTSPRFTADHWVRGGPARLIQER